jgi:hypothetical protein
MIISLAPQLQQLLLQLALDAAQRPILRLLKTGAPFHCTSSGEMNSPCGKVLHAKPLDALPRDAAAPPELG